MVREPRTTYPDSAPFPRKRSNASGLFKRRGKLELVFALAVLLWKTVLSLPAAAFDRVSNEKSSNAVRRDAQLQPSIQRHLVWLVHWTLTLYRSNR